MGPKQPKEVMQILQAYSNFIATTRSCIQLFMMELCQEDVTNLPATHHVLIWAIKKLATCLLDSWMAV